MKPKALVILAEGFEDIEAITPIDLMNRAGSDVSIAGLDSIQINGSRGTTVSAHMVFDNIENNYDAVILPGGPGANRLANSEKLKSFLIEMNKKGKIIAAICAAPAKVLSPIGILDGKKATCFKNMEKIFSSKIIYEGSDVVRDSNIITSRGAGTAFAFGLAIVEALTDIKTKQKIINETLFK